MGKQSRAVVIKKGGKVKKSLLNPLIKELYRMTGEYFRYIFLYSRPVFVQPSRRNDEF